LRAVGRCYRRPALLRPLWDELFPTEQSRIVRLLVERVEIGADGARITLRTGGLASLVSDLRARVVREAA
jgi:site-specific DNA recombinase